MKHRFEKYNRHSIRLKEYDYSQSGAYFVTICTNNRECLLGRIIDNIIELNKAGKIIYTVWSELPHYYCGIDIDEFIIMPNHIHGIILIVGAGPCACPNNMYEQRKQHGNTYYKGGQPSNIYRKGQPQGVAPTYSLPDIVHRFKSLTTTLYREGVLNNTFPPFDGRLWQRNYYEHIIKNDKELNIIRQYIVTNPLQWTMDRENPESSIVKKEESWQV